MKILRDENNQSGEVPKTRFANRLIPSVIFLIIFLSFHYFAKKSGNFYDVYHWFFLYLSLLVISPSLSNNRFGKYLCYIIQFPAAILLVLAPYINAIGTLGIIYIMVLSITGVFFEIIPSKLFNLNLQESTYIYLVLTTASIIITTNGDKLVMLWHHIQEDEKDKERQNAISLGILNQRRSKFIVFAVYFVAVVVFAFCNLNNIQLFDAPKIDTAILQSFATFVAFDRLLSNKGLLKDKISN
jgi:hypothetical protein